MCWSLDFFRSIYSFCFFRVPVCACVNLFVVKGFSQPLDLGFLNLVQTPGMISCIVYKRISHILLINPFICPFFFLSNKFFHHISSASMSARVFKFCIHNEDSLVDY